MDQNAINEAISRIFQEWLQDADPNDAPLYRAALEEALICGWQRAEDHHKVPADSRTNGFTPAGSKAA